MLSVSRSAVSVTFCCTPSKTDCLLCLQAVLDCEQHSVSYAVSGTQTAIVEYVPDEDTDMFQVRLCAVCVTAVIDISVVGVARRDSGVAALLRSSV